MKKSIKISLVVPCLNEAGNINNIYERINEVFDGINKQVIFIDDGSIDNTYKEIEELSKKFKDVEGISFSRNFGKESALLAGLKISNGEYTAFLDADLQQEPKYILDMVNILDNNPEIDIVSAKPKKRNESSIMIAFKSAFYSLINKVSDIKLEKDVSDFRTFRTNVKEALLSMPEYYRFSKGMFSWVGFNNEYIEYEVQERRVGETKWSFSKLVKYGIDGIMSYTTSPLKIALYLGVILSAISILYMFYVIIKRVFFVADIPGYTTIVVLILLIGGIQLFILGLFGEYLAKMYIQEKNRPQYIIKNKTKKD